MSGKTALARALCGAARAPLQPLEKIWADSIYYGGIAECLRDLRKHKRIESEVVKCMAGVEGFLVFS
jgi:hypothetical protein